MGNLLKVIHVLEGLQQAEHLWMWNVCGLQSTKICVRSQGAYFEGDWGIVVLCAVFLLSCIFINKCLYFSYYMAGYETNQNQNQDFHARRKGYICQILTDISCLHWFRFNSFKICTSHQNIQGWWLWDVGEPSDLWARHPIKSPESCYCGVWLCGIWGTSFEVPQICDSLAVPSALSNLPSLSLPAAGTVVIFPHPFRFPGLPSLLFEDSLSSSLL